MHNGVYRDRDEVIQSSEPSTESKAEGRMSLSVSVEDKCAYVQTERKRVKKEGAHSVCLW